MDEFKKGDIVAKCWSDGTRTVFRFECKGWVNGLSIYDGISCSGRDVTFYGRVQHATPEERHWFLLRGTQNWVEHEV